ncbi:Salicylic acid-binding protein 2 [Morella rubra]|uniref:(S)-hydroxynitrile lyase n=1 Tax=Morella rubra TaxID=262757 RepID=A0A6A1VVP5_9ROSI|nr:Salicylic acid-binding protein 2 [Morella rubra]
MAASKEKTHFVLVHGACHGAWCWNKLKPRLESAGHQVTALDLAASGINMRAIQDIHTLYEYTEPLLELLASLPPNEKVVLVGHSFGGMNLALATDKYPEKNNARNPPEELLDTEFSLYGSVNAPSTAFLLGPEVLSSKLYQLTPIELIRLIQLSRVPTTAKPKESTDTKDSLHSEVSAAISRNGANRSSASRRTQNRFVKYCMNPPVSYFPKREPKEAARPRSVGPEFSIGNIYRLGTTTKNIKDRKEKMAASKEKTHFVLVHGACHGAWCWYKVKPRLESAGHRVTALDLAASGIKMRAIQEVHTLYEYTEPLLELLVSLPPNEKVVLVGHSLGGMNLALAMDKYPEKVAVAVFLTAFMPDTTHKPSYVLDQLIERTPAEEWLDTQFSPYGSVDAPSTSMFFGPRFFSSKLYQLSPIEDLELAKALARPSSLFIEDLSKLAKNFSNEGYGSVPRVYVVCEEDMAVTKEFQLWMIENGGVNEYQYRTDGMVPPMTFQASNHVMEIKGAHDHILILQSWVRVNFARLKCRPIPRSKSLYSYLLLKILNSHRGLLKYKAYKKF